jgi:tetratricopeptide (TPR) repeat protein
VIAGCLNPHRVTIPRVTSAEAGPVVARAEQELASLDQSENARVLTARLANYRQAPLTPEHREDMQQAARMALTADRLDLFEDAIGAVERTVNVDDSEWSWGSRVLGAQLRLSWAESELLVASAVLFAVRHIESELGRIASARAIGSERVRRREREAEIQEALEQAAYFAACFQATGRRRLLAASRRVEEVLAERPEHYLGYRLAMDLHRIQGQHGTRRASDWEAFRVAARELEARRPDSTGLKFMRGAALVNSDPDAARRWLNAALAEAPHFTRAQVFRVLAAQSVEERNEEFALLREMSPHHQLIEWAAPLTEALGQ